jgi:putative flippase GtrA
MAFLTAEIKRFLIVGTITVLIDLTTYSSLLMLDVDTYLAKGVSFNIGAIFAFFANQRFTFNYQPEGNSRFILFLILYVTTLILNVSLNEFILLSIGISSLTLFMAFIITTSLSSSLNFIGMKYLVFKN